MLKGQGFDRWAEGYDASVGRSDEEGKLSLYSRIHEKQENRLFYSANGALDSYETHQRAKRGGSHENILF